MKTKESGQALVLVLILLAVGALLIVPYLQTVSTALKSRQLFGQYINEDFAADAAIEYGMWRLKYDPGFTASLPVGVQSPPFYITLNGIEASTTVIAQAPTGQLSGQGMAGRAQGEVFFKVNKTVVATTTFQILAADGFESASVSGGTGPWIGNWNMSGDYLFSTSGEHEGSYHLQLRGDDNQSPGDGYAQRQVNLSGSSGGGPYLHFWARANSFESGDTAQVKVSTDGVNWDVLRVFDSNDSSYSNYAFDLSSYGTPASFYVAFSTNLNSSSDSFNVDDLRFTNTQASATVEPGVLTEFTYQVSIQCLDPNGATLDRILDIMPNRGAASGDYLQYVYGSTQWASLSYENYAFDGFETGNGGGGTGVWSGSWSLSGNYFFDTSGEYAGNYHLRLRSNNGYARRQVNLSSATGPYLYFWAKANSFENGETAQVKVSTDGVNWDILRTFVNGEDDNTYHQYAFDLSGYGSPPVFYVAFDANMNDTNDYFYVDNVELSTYKGDDNGVWPVPSFDPAPDINGSGNTTHQELEWDFSNAGYFDIPFAYGEIKTLSFRAQAALTEGVYCNEIRLRSGGDYPNDIIGGKTAPIVVGNPANTRCTGGLLTVDKTVDPLIINPHEPTTVTYNITIKNIDTTPVRIYQIEDWLPSTGSANASEGFVYVPGSAHGAIISRPSFPFLFRDWFSRSDSNNVSNWTDGDGNGSNAVINSNYVQLRSGANITRFSIDTTGYTGIVFSYRWSGVSTAESSDLLRVEWKPSSNGTWNLLAQHPLNTTSWSSVNSTLPAGADNTSIDIRFTGNTNLTDEYGRVDQVQVSSNVPIAITPVAMPDNNQGNDFFTELWHSESYFRRWEMDWDFSNYPAPDDPLWDPGGVGAGYPNADYANDAFLEIQPGETLEIVFQAAVTLTASGTYYDEVFVKIDDEDAGGGNDAWLYGYPAAGATVPQYDIQAETLNSILRAAAMLQNDGHWWRSWHWKDHR